MTVNRETKSAKGMPEAAIQSETQISTTSRTNAFYDSTETLKYSGLADSLRAVGKKLVALNRADLQNSEQHFRATTEDLLRLALDRANMLMRGAFSDWVDMQMSDFMIEYYAKERIGSEPVPMAGFVGAYELKGTAYGTLYKGLFGFNTQAYNDYIIETKGYTSEEKTLKVVISFYNMVFHEAMHAAADRKVQLNLNDADCRMLYEAVASFYGTMSFYSFMKVGMDVTPIEDKVDVFELRRYGLIRRLNDEHLKGDFAGIIGAVVEGAGRMDSALGKYVVASEIKIDADKVMNDFRSAIYTQGAALAYIVYLGEAKDLLAATRLLLTLKTEQELNELSYQAARKAYLASQGATKEELEGITARTMQQFAPSYLRVEGLQSQPAPQF